jgi:hypothetical protein
MSETNTTGKDGSGTQQAGSHGSRGKITSSLPGTASTAFTFATYCSLKSEVLDVNSHNGAKIFMAAIEEVSDTKYDCKARRFREITK